MLTAVQEIVTALRGFDTAIFVTQHRDEPPTGRPMIIGEVEDDGTVWFLSRMETSMMKALDEDRNVAITCQGPRNFVTLSGVAELFQFPAKLREIWKPTFDRWFTNGPETPDAVAIRVLPVRADHWDPAGRHLHFGRS